MSERRHIKDILRVGSREGARLLGAAAYSALFFAPHAANHSLEETSVSTEVIGFPTTLSFSPQVTRIDALNVATIYSDKTAGDIGATIEISGLPRFASVTEVGEYFSRQQIAAYSSILGSPDDVMLPLRQRLKDEAVDTALDYELLYGAIGTGLLYSGSLGLKARRRIRQLEGKEDINPPATLYALGLGTLALAGSFTVAGSQYDQWLDSAPVPDGLSTISALHNTSLAETKIDNPAALEFANRTVMYVTKLSQRRDEDRREFLATATPNLLRELESFSPPKENEVLIATTTDIHGGEAGIELATVGVSNLQSRFGVAVTLDQGDKLYTDLQAGILEKQAAIAGEEGTFVTTDGNHDIGLTSTLSEDAGMVNLNGFEEVNGFTLYGRPDPQVTPFFGKSYFPDPDKDEAWLGETAYEETNESRVDSISLHQPLAIQALLGINSIHEFLESPSSLTTCEEDGIRDIASSIVNGGHLHDQYPIRIVCNSDGSWTVVNIQGTTGGAEEYPTINRWSDPAGRPIKPISLRLFYYNTKYDSVTGYANVVANPNGEVDPILRTDIGTSDGAPFATVDAVDQVVQPLEADKRQKNKLRNE